LRQPRYWGDGLFGKTNAGRPQRDVVQKGKGLLAQYGTGRGSARRQAL